MIRCSGNENLKQVDREISSENRVETEIEQNLWSVNRPENLPTQSPYDDKCFAMRAAPNKFVDHVNQSVKVRKPKYPKPLNTTEKSVNPTETELNSLGNTASVSRQLL